jgi:hypothetical protein
MKSRNDQARKRDIKNNPCQPFAIFFFDDVAPLEKIAESDNENR